MVDFVNKYPYTDFHELNLDWILETIKQLTAEWAETLTAWADEQQAFQDLHDYVMNYFNNLDVQAEINHKLDIMAADGTLDALLLPYFNAYKAEINAIIATQNDNIGNISTRIDTLTGRVDNLATLSEGSTTGDAELIDGRAPYAGLMNNSYASIGNAIRGQTEYLTNDVIQLSSLISSGTFIYDMFEQGRYGGTAKDPATNRIRSANSFHVFPGTVINVESVSLTTAVLEADYIGQTSGISNTQVTAGNSQTFTFTAEKIVYFVCFYADNSNITPGDYDSVITITVPYIKEIIDHNSGRYTGKLIKNHRWAAVGTPRILQLDVQIGKCAYDELIDLSVHKVVRIQQSLANLYRIVCFFSDSNNEYISAYTTISGAETLIINSANYPSAKYMSIAIDANSTPMTDTEMTNVLNASALYTSYEDDIWNVGGKHIMVYKYGDDGNDYCFVRTPSSYDPKAAKPYKFVICNHGNGWTMNGQVTMANYTKKTMYVPLDDPDYAQDPTQYNGTSDNTLWYSNPTIEALLTAGYIVCGCENYADNLYGNNNCRNACVTFFNHMVKHYNVEDRCYMIGASNGMLTTLNANYLLQGHIRAIISQYGLTCLMNQYEHYPSHQSAIKTAYGLGGSATTEDVRYATRTHDPLTTDVVDGIRSDVIAPIKLYYSNSDTVTAALYNSLALATMLNNSNKVVETVECSGSHGDASHFKPAEVVAWFNAN